MLDRRCPRRRATPGAAHGGPPPSQATHCRWSVIRGKPAGSTLSASGPSVASPPVDACAFEEFLPHLGEVVRLGTPHRAQGRPDVDGQARPLEAVPDDGPIVDAAPVGESLGGSRHRLPLPVVVLGDAPLVVLGTVVDEKAAITSARSTHTGSVVASAALR